MSGPAVRALFAEAGATLAAAVATALGALALVPVFTDGSWRGPVLAAVAVVAAGGLVLRAGGRALGTASSGSGRPSASAAALGVLLVALGQAALLVWLMTGLFAPGTGTVAGLPTRASLARLGGVLADGTVQLREQATPALPLTGLVALTVVLVGLVAVVVDLVAVGARQAGLAGLALLVLYSVPVTTVTGSIGPLAVLAPAAGLALLLWTDQWRRLGDRPRRGRRRLPGAGTGTAVRTGVGAAALALLLGPLVPTMAEGSLAGGFGTGRGGGSTGTSLDPAAALQGQLALRDPVDLLRVEAAVEDPGYLRVVALEDYDAAAGWSVGDLDGELSVTGDAQLAPLPGGRPGRPVEALVTALGHEDRFLPVFSSPLAVVVADGERWRFDPATATVFASGATTAGQTWSVLAARPDPTEAELAAAPPLPPELPLQRRYTALPPLDPAVLDLVATLTAGRTAPYERVRAVYDHLTDPGNGFSYSLSTRPGTSGDDLVDFLTAKRGYCEQYAGAMAAMVRAAGVPARVVLGYTPGTLQPDGSRLVTSDDAHAWVEVYFDDLGWIPFDPTPIDADRAMEVPWSPRPQDLEVDPRTDLPTAQAQATPPPAPQQQPQPGDTPAAGPAASSGVPLAPVLLGAAAVLGAAGLGASPAAARALQRRRRLADGGAAALWDELTATALDLGVPDDPTRTPRQAAERLAGRVARAGDAPDPAAAEAVRRLARAEEAASYARPGGAAADPELRAALAAARRALLAAAPRSARWRALLWPASLWAGLRGRLSRPSWPPTGREAPSRG